MHTFISSHFHSKIQDKSTNFLNNTKFYFKKNIKHYPPCIMHGDRIFHEAAGCARGVYKGYPGAFL